MHPRERGEDNTFPSAAGINLGEREPTLSCFSLDYLCPGYVGVVLLERTETYVRRQNAGHKQSERERKGNVDERGRFFDQTPKTYAV